MSNTSFTYQTRPQLTYASSSILDEYAQLFGHTQRCLFADIAKENNALSVKNSYLKKFGITARQYNAIRVDTVGKIDSTKKLLPLQIQSLQESISSLEKKVQNLEKKKKAATLHQKKRRLQNLKHRFEKMQSDRKNGKVRLCFGRKKLFRAQFHLDKNGYATHEEWRQEWQQARNSQFFVLGSKDETAGNQSCQATVEEDGSLTIKLRLPNTLVEKYGKALVIPNVRFQYGHDTILASLQSCQERKTGNKTLGQAICYRFKKDKKGWILFATTEMEKPKTITRENTGAIGLDINANHLALVETDRFGNPIEKRTIPLNLYGKSKNQTLALIGEASKEIITWAERVQKPIIHEQLNFQKKKAALKENHTKKLARMLSSLSYNQIIQYLEAKAYRHGIATHAVNPAYTSVIGHIKFTHRYGLSKHHAAALTITRRHYQFSEKPTQSSATIPDGKDSQLTFSLPVRNRLKHVWSFWSLVRRKTKTALAAHFQARNRSTDPPRRSVRQEISGCCW